MDWLDQFIVAQPSLLVLPAVALAGVLGAMSSCCTMGVLASVAGFSTATHGERRRNATITAVAFLLGTIVALTILGSITGLVSEQLGASLGYWWTLAAGMVMVVFGLVALEWLPIRLPVSILPRVSSKRSSAGSALFGLALGGGQVACSTTCMSNPALMVALAFALQGDSLWGATVMAAYAIGYSLPLAGVLMGINLGVGRLTAQRLHWLPKIRTLGGITLIAVGIVMMATS